MDWPVLIPAAQVTAAGALLAIVYLLIRAISRGDWVPRRELDYLRQDRDDRIREASERAERAEAVSVEYRHALETSERARELLHQTVRDAVDTFRVTNHFFDAFRARIIEERPADIEGEGRDGHDSRV